MTEAEFGAEPGVVLHDGVERGRPKLQQHRRLERTCLHTPTRGPQVRVNSTKNQDGSRPHLVYIRIRVAIVNYV
jgi:hypothetical protein